MYMYSNDDTAAFFFLTARIDACSFLLDMPNKNTLYIA